MRLWSGGYLRYCYVKTGRTAPQPLLLGRRYTWRAAAVATDCRESLACVFHCHLLKLVVGHYRDFNAAIGPAAL